MDLLGFLISIGSSLSISDIFSISRQTEKVPIPTYAPACMICFVGKHYLCFIRDQNA